MNYPTYNIESEVLKEGYKYIVGVDEAGRGSLAGPVVAAAVHISKEAISKLTDKVNDSKKLSAKRRDILFDLIKETCVYGVQAIPEDVIDDINILEATKIAMKSAVEQLEYYDYVLIDGTVDLSKYLWCPAQKIIKGDTLALSIAAASIIAKVTRDRLVMKMHEEFPIYNWNKNKTYGTKDHKELIKLYGPCVYHRKTFGGVKEHL